MNTESEPTPQTNATEAVCWTLEPETRWFLMRDLAERLERDNENLRNALHLARNLERQRGLIESACIDNSTPA